MRIVTVVLGKGLFKDSHPHSAVSRDFAEQSLTIPDGKPIIDNHGVGNTKSVEVDGIDSGTVQGRIFIEEDLLDTAWLFSDSRGS